jgi:hypothetical protein
MNSRLTIDDFRFEANAPGDVPASVSIVNPQSSVVNRQSSIDNRSLAAPLES